jgi:hypothetical protein
MKMRVDAAQFAEIRKQAMLDELYGLDPGAYWARIFPGVTEIEFVAVDPPRTLEQIVAEARAALGERDE